MPLVFPCPAGGVPASPRNGGPAAGKHGNKEAMVTWTYVCITVAAVLVVLFIFIDPTLIATTLPMMIVYVLLTLVLNGAKMCVTMSSNAMMADIIDYELDRSGKFIPAAVTGTYLSLIHI